MIYLAGGLVWLVLGVAATMLMSPPGPEAADTAGASPEALDAAGPDQEANHADEV